MCVCKHVWETGTRDKGQAQTIGLVKRQSGTMPSLQPANTNWQQDAQQGLEMRTTYGVELSDQQWTPNKTVIGMFSKPVELNNQMNMFCFFDKRKVHLIQNTMQPLSC